MKKTTDYSGKNGLYCCVTPVRGFQPLLKLISEKLSEEGIDVYRNEDFHCTVMYSRYESPHPIRVVQLLDAPPHNYKAWSDCLDYWPGHDNEGYLVLRVTSRDLTLRHAAYKELGCQHSFPLYEAHISIATGIAKPKCLTALNKLLKNLKFEITFSGEHVEDILGD